MAKVIFITGCSSGLGLELVKSALIQGHKVVATLRTPSDFDQTLLEQCPKTLELVKLDVTSQSEVRAALDRAVEVFGRIDVLLSNAGWTVLGEFETLPEDQARKCFETVFWGAMNVHRLAIPLLRDQGGGKIVSISSMVGLGGGIPLLSYFAAAKMALEGAIDAIQAELLPSWNVELRLVEPGGFKTSAMEKAHFSELVPPYDAPDHFMTHVRAQFGGGGQGDSTKASTAILEFALFDPPADVPRPLRLVLGPDAIGFVQARLDNIKNQLDSFHELGLSTA